MPRTMVWSVVYVVGLPKLVPLPTMTMVPYTNGALAHGSGQLWACAAPPIASAVQMRSNVSQQ
jgi:hypothetical protein